MLLEGNPSSAAGDNLLLPSAKDTKDTESILAGGEH